MQFFKQEKKKLFFTKMLSPNYKAVLFIINLANTKIKYSIIYMKLNYGNTYSSLQMYRDCKLMSWLPVLAERKKDNISKTIRILIFLISHRWTQT